MYILLTSINNLKFLLFSYTRGPQIFPVKDQVVNILSSVSYTVAITTTQLYHHSAKLPIDNTKTNEGGWVLIRLHLYKQTTRSGPQVIPLSQTNTSQSVATNQKHLGYFYKLQFQGPHSRPTESQSASFFNKSPG